MVFCYGSPSKQILRSVFTVITFSSVQSLSRVRLFETSWTAARQASLSTTNSRSPPKPMSIELVMPSNHLIFCRPLSSCPQFFLASGSFQMSQLFASGGQSIGVSASTSVLPMNTQDWSPLGWTVVEGTLKSLLQHHSSFSSLNSVSVLQAGCRSHALSSR